MAKRRLDLDELEVESFATQTVSAFGGTVQGRMTGATACDPDSCDTCRFNTCWDTCDPDATCALSCNPSCVVTWCTCDDTCNCA
jgi:hypothetical protein